MRSSQLSSQASSAKKQQSIASFFTKASAPAKSSPPAKKSSPQAPRPSDKDNIFLSDDENDAATTQKPAGPKRTRSSNDVDKNSEDEDVLPVRKRARKSSDDAGDIPSPKTPTLQPTSANGAKKPRISDRTARYLFSGSPEKDIENADDDATKARKERLHNAFVKKLGRPDSIAEIKRRNHFISEDANEAGEEDEDAAEDEDEPKPAKKKGIAAKKSSSKLTPMEKQVIDIKTKHPDAVLVIEVGYKFRFFGADAKVAAKELHIVCIPGKLRFDEHPSEAHLDRFASASIPTHRLHVHVKRLVAAGHKVGVVRQLETAALKAAGDNRNAPFVRKLTNLYTKGTYIDDVEGLEGPAPDTSNRAPVTGYLLCITETPVKGANPDEKVNVGIIAVQPATGDVIYDDFEDGFMRSEVETRLLHIAPCEFLIVGELSRTTEKLVHHLSGSKTNVFGDKSRVERVERKSDTATTAHNHVSNFYAGKMRSKSNKEDAKARELLEKILNLPQNVTVCLSAMIHHMTDYGLEHVFDLTKYFQTFNARSHMLLNGTTLSSLEIYQNQTDHTQRGSLFWSMDRTQTRFGQRLLRKWVGRPLLDRNRLEERLIAVEEIKDADSPTVDQIRSLLGKVKSDLEKSLIRIYYGRCSRPELLTVLQTMQRIATEFSSVKSIDDVGFKSHTLNAAVAALPVILDDVLHYLDKINPEAAKSDDKYEFFRESEETEAITEHKLGIASVEHDLDEHRAVAGQKIKKKTVEYKTVSGIDYLIEVENTQLKNVPASWTKISGTKRNSRFHTPEVVRMMKERDQHKESLAAACDTAFKNLLADIAAKYQAFRDCVQALATLDCLFSLAAIASQPGYCRPEFPADDDDDGGEPAGAHILIDQGRHPMVEQLLLDSYVPNDTALQPAGPAPRALLITGPNMGGKSSYVRQVALIAVMAQVGSWVPARRARLGLLDAVFTRMGARDNVLAGESTFMVELSETAAVLRQATSRSLVVLDELGRGTSTHDGVAIARAVLDYVVRERRALTLFITHYQNLAKVEQAFDGGELKNVHMRFTEEEDKRGAGGKEITFLYEVGEGVAHRSYGLNVARLAHVPDSVLEVAEVKSKELEEEVQRKKLAGIASVIKSFLHDSKTEQLDLLAAGIEEL